MDNEGHFPEEHQASCHGETGSYQADAEAADIDIPFDELGVLQSLFRIYTPLHTTVFTLNEIPSSTFEPLRLISLTLQPTNGASVSPY